MNENDHIPSAIPNPPMSSSAANQPQDTLLQRGAFDPPFTPGTLGRLDKYEILRFLGEGSMGQVYLAREPVTGVQVAIKIIKPQMAVDPQSAHRFLIEARHMYGMAHPHVLRVLDVSDRKEGPYYVMSYVEGGSLRTLCKPGQALPDQQLLPIAQQIAGALAYAHTRGIIHRDLKPDNVLLDKQGNAALSDFGLVRTVFNDSMVDPTASHLEGTAPYMSPAVAQGEAEDTRCDIYAFGAVLYELLTGQLPYTGRTPQMILDQVLKGPPPPIRTVNPKANPALVKIAEGCMARELRDRYANMTDVVADLDCVAKGKSPFGPHRQQRGSPRIAAMVAVGLVVAGVIGLAVHRLITAPHRTIATTTTTQPEQVPLPLSVESKAKTQLSPGPIAWWKADGNALDSAGINHGTLKNVEFADGMFGQAFRMDGSGTSYVTVPNSPKLALGSNDFTIALWANFGTPSSVQTLLGSDDGGGNLNKWIFWVAGGRLQLHVNMEKAGGYYLGAGLFSPKTNRWHHLAVVNRGHNYSFYVDGIEIYSEFLLLSIPKTIAPLTIGKAESFTFNGLLDDIRIYTRALSPDELETIVNTRTLATVAIAASPAPTDERDFSCTAKSGSVTIVRYTGDGGVVTIPGTISGLPVTMIKNEAFLNCSNVTSVTIPTSVTNIGNGAFSGCSSLTSITIPAGVASINWNSTFSGCTSLSSILVDILNPTYTSSRDGIVFNKEKTVLLRYPMGRAGNYEIPNSVTGVGDGAFHGSIRLTGITIPTGVADIGGGAFYGCSGLTTVTIPASAVHIAWTAFSQCSRLDRIMVDNANPTYASDANGIVFTKDKTKLVRYPPGRAGNYLIPTHVTQIGGGAFEGSVGLTSVTIPDSVTTLENGAFRSCTNLTHLSISGGVTRIPNEAFRYCTALSDVTIPTSVATIGWWAFGDCSSLKSGTIPNSVTRIENGAFTGCVGLTNITLPNSNLSIGGGAFQSCRSLTSVAIPDGVVNIVDWVFGGCTSLVSVTIPASVAKIEYCVFVGCVNLTSIYCKGDAPSGASDGSLFHDANKVTVYHLPGTTGWGKEFGGRPTAVWTNATAAADTPAATAPSPFTYTSTNGTIIITKYTGPGGVVTIPGKIDGLPVTGIGDWSFQHRGLTSVTIPTSVTNIGYGAFEYCGLTNVMIPASVTFMGENPFGYNGGLLSISVDSANPVFSSGADGVLFSKDKTRLVVYPAGKAGSYAIPEGVSCIVGRAFLGNVRLSSVTIPASVTNIGQLAFWFCRGLTNITIPFGVTSIGPETFRGCVSLTSVTISDSVTSIGFYAFDGCARLVSVIIPASVTSIGGCAFQGCASLVGVYVKGDAPNLGGGSFAGASKATIYHLPGTKGWGKEFGGRPTAVWNPKGEGITTGAKAD